MNFQTQTTPKQGGGVNLAVPKPEVDFEVFGNGIFDFWTSKMDGSGKARRRENLQDLHFKSNDLTAGKEIIQIIPVPQNPEFSWRLRCQARPNKGG